MGLDTYRFSVEWARIEPAEGEFSDAALAHYRAMVGYCRAAGIAPVVTYNHFTTPHWFAARGGWLDERAPELFGRYCGVVTERLGDGIAWAVTLNEADTSVRDRKRAEVYGRWLGLAREDDFLGVQNYTRDRYDGTGPVPPPPGAAMNQMGGEIWPPSLGGAVRYAHAATGLALLVTEHGLGHRDDSVRAAFIGPALAGLLDAIEDGAPVLGYLHWSLLDNFEWVFGYDVRFGLHEVDRVAFARTAKPSAGVYSAIARANAVA